MSRRNQTLCAWCAPLYVLGILVGLVLVAGVLGAAVGMGSRLLGQPVMTPTVTTAADGSRAQQKLFASVKRRLDRENPGYER